jgi:hypothetical protein
MIELKHRREDYYNDIKDQLKKKLVDNAKNRYKTDCKSLFSKDLQINVKEK